MTLARDQLWMKSCSILGSITKELSHVCCLHLPWLALLHQPTLDNFYQIQTTSKVRIWLDQPHQTWFALVAIWLPMVETQWPQIVLVPPITDSKIISTEWSLPRITRSGSKSGLTTPPNTDSATVWAMKQPVYSSMTPRRSASIQMDSTSTTWREEAPTDRMWARSILFLTIHAIYRRKLPFYSTSEVTWKAHKSQLQTPRSQKRWRCSQRE